MGNNKKWMQIAVNVGQRNLGKTYPNPSVGAVIVKDGELLAKAVTGIGGTPHAETTAINSLSSEQLKGAELYVTLEPCCHKGKTPPCTKAIIKSGIKKVVVGHNDPNPEVFGQGILELKHAGIEVVVLNDPAAIELHKMFFHFISLKSSYLTCKVATTLDGKIALGNGNSKWITSDDSRSYVHYLRAKHDAILTGIGTVQSDDPKLSCRIDGMEQERLVIVLDRRLEISLDRYLVRNANKSPLWLVTTTNDEAKIASLKELNVEVTVLSEGDYNNAQTLLSLFAERGITSIFCEAGKLITKFVKASLIDELVIFRAPKFLGEGSYDMCGNLNLSEISKDREFELSRAKKIAGGDALEFYNKAHKSL